MQRVMNEKVKFRESFRPFAPCVLQERAHEIFDWAEGTESPYMLLVAPVRPSLRRPLTKEEEVRMREDTDLLSRINVVRSEYPAITHVDYSARIQTVDAQRHGRFYRLMKAFGRADRQPAVRGATMLPAHGRGGARARRLSSPEGRSASEPAHRCSTPREATLSRLTMGTFSEINTQPSRAELVKFGLILLAASWIAAGSVWWRGNVEGATWRWFA